jgi:ABC-type antimicrobial peptide transport system permease subunit
LARFRKTENAAILGEEYFEKTKGKYPWEVGQDYILKDLSGISIKFVGRFKSTNPVYNTMIFTGREFIQNVNASAGSALSGCDALAGSKDARGHANQVYIKIDDSENIEKVISTLDGDGPLSVGRNFPYKTTTVDQKSYLTNAVQDLQGQVEVSRWIMLITIAVILIAVANTISMATRDRVQEIGILRSMGFRKVHISMLVLGESMLLALFGGALGIALVFAARYMLESAGVNFAYGQCGINIDIYITAGVLYMAAALSIAVGFLGGLIPAVAAGRLNIVNSLRNVD